MSLLLNGSKNGDDRGWYEIDSDQIYYYTTSPSQQGEGSTRHNVKRIKNIVDEYLDSRKKLSWVVFLHDF